MEPRHPVDVWARISSQPWPMRFGLTASVTRRGDTGCYGSATVALHKHRGLLVGEKFQHFRLSLTKRPDHLFTNKDQPVQEREPYLREVFAKRWGV